MRRLILGTAGHIDHGKTALVRALTGTDTDRLPEEKERGITIDLGFAHLELDGGARVGIVDVPGHESFVRNMLAGASGIDFLLLVVAADEGVMPQTREHVAIASLLGVESAVVAVTKRDLVQDEWLELVIDDVADFLADTPLAGAAIVPVSALDGTGLDPLRDALEAAAERARARGEDDLFRLPVDRVFTVKGTGTVVTGTVWSGTLRDAVAVRVLPQDTEARVRGLQVHGVDVESVVAGQRAAVALAVDRATVPRGSVLVGEGAWVPARMVTARVELIRETDWVLEHRQRIRFHLGTAEVMGRAVLLDRDLIPPGDEGWVQLRLEAPVVARAGDRFVLRSYSPVTTIGGGTVVEPVAPKRKQVDAVREHLEAILRGDPRAAVRSSVRQAGLVGVTEAALAIRTPYGPAVVASTVDAIGQGVVRVGDCLFTDGSVAELRDGFVEAVERFHRQEPLQPGMERTRLRRVAPRRAEPALVEHIIGELLREGVLRALDGLVAERDFTPVLDEGQRAARDTLISIFRDAGLSPPPPAELPDEIRGRPDFHDLLRLLEFESVIVALTPELYMARTALDDAAERIRRELGGREELSPTDFKALLDVSRKYLIPILEYFDEQGLTARHAAGRSVARTGTGG